MNGNSYATLNSQKICLEIVDKFRSDVVKASGDEFVYVAALPVSQVSDVPEGMVVCNIPKATYALFTHKGAIADIRLTVEYIWGTWVPKSGRELADSPDFELYDERFDPETGTGEVDIYVPVKD
jgi:AraC family transcriptional regulator